MTAKTNETIKKLNALIQYADSIDNIYLRDKLTSLRTDIYDSISQELSEQHKTYMILLND